MVRKGNVLRVSNEVEIPFKKRTNIPLLIDKCRKSKLEVVPEVNADRMVELNISKAENVEELNERLYAALYRFALLCSGQGIDFGENPLLPNADLDNVNYYRTVALSRTLAEGLIRIASFQIVIGFDSEDLGFKFYNLMRTLGSDLANDFSNHSFLPNEQYYLDAVTYSFGEDKICYRTNPWFKIPFNGSTRLEVIYPYMTHKLPSSMVNMPKLESMSEYYHHLAIATRDVKFFLDNGVLDADHERLRAFGDFDLLEPHQVYWLVRIRPDHADSEAKFTVEVRHFDYFSDFSVYMKINNIVIGLAYALEKGISIDDAYYAYRQGLKWRGFNEV